MKLVYILLCLGFIKCVVLYKVYHSVPVLELKRRARQGDKKAGRLYKTAIYEQTLDLVLWLAGVAIGAALVIWSARTNWWLATIVMVVMAWLVVWSRFSADGWAGSFIAYFSPVYGRFLSFIQPVAGRLAMVLPPGRRVSVHTGLYERKDLLDFLTRQNRQLDNRLSPGDLQIARNSLTFGDKTVGSVMTPRKVIKFVGQGESVGPILIDELHQTGFSRFPVVKDSAKAASPQVVGTLYLNNLIGYDGKGKVKDLMKHEVYFINEDANLRQALGAFLRTHHHLLIVVNSFEEVVGVLSLEDVLEQIIGKQIVDEFDGYESLRAVAAMKAEAEQAQHQEVKPAAAEPTETAA
jgi:CBS domain containing-hemolysin-like protein